MTTLIALPEQQTTGRRTGAVLLLAVAVGSGAYAVAVSVLARWPSIVRARGAGGAARPVLIAAVAVPVAVAGAVLLLGGRGAAPRHVTGAARGHLTGAARGHLTGVALVGFGAAWVAWGLLEQHVLRSFDLTPGSAAAGAWDALFHAVGLVAAAVGTSLVSGRSPGSAVPGAT